MVSLDLKGPLLPRRTTKHHAIHEGKEDNTTLRLCHHNEKNSSVMTKCIHTPDPAFKSCPTKVLDGKTNKDRNCSLGRNKRRKHPPGWKAETPKRNPPSRHTSGSPHAAEAALSASCDPGPGLSGGARAFSFSFSFKASDGEQTVRFGHVRTDATASLEFLHDQCEIACDTCIGNVFMLSD